jgi:hypothetical protein
LKRIVAALLGLGLAFGLSACAQPNPNQASPEQAAAAAYVPDEPPKLTLFTVVNNTSGAGGHTSLLVTGSQQVLYDPAGSFVHEGVPERGDVLYGMSSTWVQAYKSAHARSTYHVVSQEIRVTPAQAERALQLVQSRGPAPDAFCTNVTSSILKDIPGFEDVKQTWYPVDLMEQIAQRPNVVTDLYYEDDEGNVRDGIADVQTRMALTDQQ